MFALAMLAVLQLSVAALVLDASTLDWTLFESFITNHSRSYKSDINELNYRFRVFQVSASVRINMLCVY